MGTGPGTIVNKKVFDVEGTKYCVVRPDAKLQNKAQLFKAKKIRETAEGGALLREEVDKLLRERKIWDEEKENLYRELVKSLKEDEVKLAGAKRQKMKLTEVRDLSFQMASTFQSIQSLQNERNSLDSLTSEGMAAAAEFDFLLSHCTRNADGSPFYASYEDMTEREECPVYEKAKTAFLDLIYIPYEDNLKKRPEWKFLLEHKFVNADLKLVDKEGNLIDGFGRKLDEKGRLVNEKGQLVNGNGDLVDELGFLVASDEGYFTDDEGNPLGADDAPLPPAPSNESENKPQDAPAEPPAFLAPLAKGEPEPEVKPGFVSQEVIDAVS